MMGPRGKVAPAVVITVVSVLVTVVMSMTVFMPAWAPTSPFRAMRVRHQDVFIILLGGHIVWGFLGCLCLIVI